MYQGIRGVSGIISEDERIHQELFKELGSKHVLVTGYLERGGWRGGISIVTDCKENGMEKI